MTISGKPGSSGVFICHRTPDASLARRLAEQIRDSGFNVWLDEWEILIGDSVVERINSGLENAKYVVVCYSESGVLSKWMSREWMAALARQLEGRDMKLLPARLSGGAPPAILADVKFADLVKDWNRGLEDLLRAMR
jgi:hypothetical protein